MPRQRIMRRLERLERLERAGLSDHVGQALRAYHATGTLPPAGPVRDMVLRIDAFSRAALQLTCFPTCPKEPVD